jgi:hypothetical protein
MGITTLNVVTKFGPLDLDTACRCHELRRLGRRSARPDNLRNPDTTDGLADIVRSKEAANRDKDKAQLPLLRSLLGRLRRRAE